MTSDRSPSMLKNLEERLSSRFEWGMVAEIDKPNFELRLMILKRKCEDQGFDNIPDESAALRSRNSDSKYPENWKEHW